MLMVTTMLEGTSLAPLCTRPKRSMPSSVICAEMGRNGEISHNLVGLGDGCPSASTFDEKCSII